MMQNKSIGRLLAFQCTPIYTCTLRRVAIADSYAIIGVLMNIYEHKIRANKAFLLCRFSQVNVGVHRVFNVHLMFTNVH